MAPLRIATDDYERIATVIAGSLRRISPGLSHAQVEDVTQRALVGLIQHRDRHEGVDGYSPSYLRKAAYHALIDELRQTRRQPYSELEEQTLALPSTQPGPEELSAGREIGEAIRECLSRLPPPRRLALSLVLLGHTVPEVAELGGWDAKQAENLVYRGRKDVKACLREKRIEP
jgi:RNA polymerase sigma-70 factor (ECF subfamily)